MMLHSISDTTFRQLLNNGVDISDSSDPACLKQNRHAMSHKACGRPLQNAFLWVHFMHARVGYGRKLKTNHLISATLDASFDPEKCSWELSNDVYKFDFGDSDSILGDSDAKADKSVSDSEVGEFDYRLIPQKMELDGALNLQEDLYDKLKAVQLHLLASEQWNASRLKLYRRTYLMSATNLIHYLTLQTLDIQQLKEDLSSVGLLNLDSINSCVLASISAGIWVLENLKSFLITTKLDINVRSLSAEGNESMLTISTMRKMASIHAETLFGPPQNGRLDHIMVTVGKEAIYNGNLIKDLLKAGANIFRINCAHDDPNIWGEIIRIIRSNSQMLERSCRILMDLAGPKLRTGMMKPGPNVMKISPKKDSKGDVIFPARVWLSYDGLEPPSHLSPDAFIYLDDYQLLTKIDAGDIVTFSDYKGRHRVLKITQKVPIYSGIGFMAECSKTAYVESGTELYIKVKKKKFSLGHVVTIPPMEQFIRLKRGELLIITKDSSLNELGSSSIGAPRITCSSGLLFDSVKPGEPISFDDGKIWGEIQGVSMSEIVVTITHAGPRGSKLGSEKSINIPKSEMQFEGLTSKDLLDLEFVAANADMVGISFIRQVRDVALVQRELDKRNIQKLGIVLKIETQSGFDKLPLLLLQAMESSNPLGVMIARGDLAVECGWDKLAAMQEDILSVCSAAHVPVVWATQVLESLVKSGLPTRAEVTDVACGMRANCIMLNKGKHIVEAVSALDSILRNSYRKKNVISQLKPIIFCK